MNHEIITPEEEIQQSQSAKDYFLMHRRFTYLGRSIIIKLHEVTTYRPIHRLKYKGPYTTCVIEKMKKKITRIVTSRKDEILDLIFINACGPLSKSLINNIIFLEIVNNYSRMHWRIYTKNKKLISMKLDI